ncbi:MAG: PASTA domain-containing protein [Tannerella sp.]|jgi:beta-lactam-binding protein with PASTA domain|nr:PASTA domain-containing protein [Tannerella sp.]
MKSFIDKIFKLPVYVHLLAVGVFMCLIICFVLKSIDSYTNHNQAVHVPDVRGLQVKDAAPFFEQNRLRYVIVDSIFSKDAAPGAIVELLPEANSKVKKNRIVYVTVNAKTEETAPVPDITDISFRQAYALLSARGFIDVEHKYVSGEYRDLTLGVEYEGRMINSGTRVPLTAKLTLVVSDGNIMPQEDDSIENIVEIIGGDESWF